MNRCPSCRSLVPAGWIACRRCGAALSAGRPPAAIDNALPRRPVPGAGAATATLTRPASPAVVPVARDTLLPGEHVDTMLSATSRARPRVAVRMRVVAICIGVVAVALVAWTALHATTGGSSKASNARTHAEALVQRAAVAAAPTFAAHKSFASLTPLALGRAAGVRVVAGDTPAAAGTLSMKNESATRITVATPASRTTCVFGRDDAGRVTFAFTSGHACRADAAPRYGWGAG